jgi:nicotinamidase/pyrazinamidase
MAMQEAVIVVDVQRDFCQGGALAAHDTKSLVDPLLKYLDLARISGRLVVFTQDWHPRDHGSFRINGGPWPEHCVAETLGAEIMPPLAIFPEDMIVRKGTHAQSDSYSAFAGTDLAIRLRVSRIHTTFITGIATEYCVRATALDARAAGFEVCVLSDLIRPVSPASEAKVLAELVAAGVTVRTSST